MEGVRRFVRVCAARERVCTSWKHSRNRTPGVVVRLAALAFAPTPHEVSGSALTTVTIALLQLLLKGETARPPASLPPAAVLARAALKRRLAWLELERDELVDAEPPVRDVTAHLGWA